MDLTRRRLLFLATGAAAGGLGIGARTTAAGPSHARVLWGSGYGVHRARGDHDRMADVAGVART